MWGIQALIAAVYVHCRNHTLNLAIVHSLKVRDVRNYLDTVQEMVNFITASLKRLQGLMENNRNKKRLQKFSGIEFAIELVCRFSFPVFTVDID